MGSCWDSEYSLDFIQKNFDLEEIEVKFLLIVISKHCLESNLKSNFESIWDK